MNYSNSVGKNRVIVVEPDKILLQCYSHVIHSAEKFIVAGAYENAEEALQEITKTKPDIVVMDIELPGMSGISATQKIKEFFPRTAVVIVTCYDDHQHIFDSLKAGASGYIIKTNNYLEVIKGLEELVSGGAPASSKIVKILVHYFHINPDSPLSKREREVLTLLSEGKTYTEISRFLGIASDTSKKHIRNIYEKLNVNKKSDAIELASLNRLI